MGFKAVQSRAPPLSLLGASPPHQMRSTPLTVVCGLAPAYLPTSPCRSSLGLRAQSHWRPQPSLCASSFLCLEGPPLSLRGHTSITRVPLLKGHLLREAVPDCNISCDTSTPFPLSFCSCPFSLSKMIFICLFLGGLSPWLSLGSKRTTALSCLR